MAPLKLGELLVRAGVLEESKLRLALAQQQKWGGRLGEVLIRMGAVSEEQVVQALSAQLGIPAVNVDALSSLPPYVKAKVPADMLRDLAVLPLQLKDQGKTLVVAMAEPQNIEHLDALRARTGCRIVPQLAGRTAIARAHARLYGAELDESDSNEAFKMVDAQGRTVVRAVERTDEPASPARKAPPAPLRSDDALAEVRDLQRKQMAVLRAIVELLIEKGVFTREEYLARLRQP